MLVKKSLAFAKYPSICKLEARHDVDLSKLITKEQIKYFILYVWLFKQGTQDFTNGDDRYTLLPRTYNLKWSSANIPPTLWQ